MTFLPKSIFAGTVIILSSAAIMSCSSYRAENENAPLTFATSPQSYTTTILSDTSLVAVGDSASLSVWGYPEFGTRAIVKATGTITAPLLGEVMAAGLTKSEFAKILKDKLAEYIAGEIKMSLEISNPIPRITVLGSVGRQGSFAAISDMPLLEAISTAGGWLPDSDLRYVKITRQATMEGDRRFIEIDLNAFLESGNARALPMVHPGDVVIIPARENFVRNVGEFFRDAFLIFGVFGLFK
jgi:polysaccharide export outer membrane protein